MCLEVFNPFLGLPLAWLALSLLGVVLAALALFYLFASPRQSSSNEQPPSFTCPCHAPSVPQPENDQQDK